MTRRRKLTLMALTLLAILLILFVPTGLPHALAGLSRERLEPPPFARPGPYLVGLHQIRAADGAPLDLTLWYPATQDASYSAGTRYGYRVKMGEPFGTVSLASFSGLAAADAPYDRSHAPYPVVLLSPGFSLGSSNYGWLAERLSGYGFFVVAVEHEERFDEELNGLWQAVIVRPNDVTETLDYLGEEAAQGGPLAGLIDLDRVAVVGHSYGGSTALAAGGARMDSQTFKDQCDAAYAAGEPNPFLCDEVLPHLDEMAALAGLASTPEGLWPSAADPRVDAIVSLAGDAVFFGERGLSEIAVPVLAIGGTADDDSPYIWGTGPAYEYASSPLKARVALTDAEHMIFNGPCERLPLALSFALGEFCQDRAWDRGRAHDLTGHFAVAFLMATLKDDPAAAQWLRSDHIEFSGLGFDSQGF